MLFRSIIDFFYQPPFSTLLAFLDFQLVLSGLKKNPLSRLFCGVLGVVTPVVATHVFGVQISIAMARITIKAVKILSMYSISPSPP
jgi:hypothetical protein